MNRSSQKQKRRICFVTGSRAEFGLMQSTLWAIKSHPQLKLQIIATGMHLDPSYGKPLSAIRNANFQPTTTVSWISASSSPHSAAAATGQAIAALAEIFKKLKPHFVLLTGDRVESFAAAAAAHISQIPIAHVHGGDRALGQIDDSLRHAITKLAHIHFPATSQSAQRLSRLGEDRWRIHLVGSPGVDLIHESVYPWGNLQETFDGIGLHRYALLILHPTIADDDAERRRAKQVLHATLGAGFDQTIIIYPNNDPGSGGIIRTWQSINFEGVNVFEDMPRPLYLGLLKHAAMLIGNSSSGIIEAASFGTPVINIGDRQKGRERNKNVIDVPSNPAAIDRALKKVWNNGRPIRFPAKNIYGSGRTSEKIAHILATVALDDRLRRKLISY